MQVSCIVCEQFAATLDRGTLPSSAVPFQCLASVWSRDHHDLRDQRFGRQTAGHDMLRRMRLGHCDGTAPAGIFRTTGDQHAALGRHHVQPLGDILADPGHFTATAGTEFRFGFDDPLDPRQMFGKIRSTDRRRSDAPANKNTGTCSRGCRRHRFARWPTIRGRSPCTGVRYPSTPASTASLPQLCRLRSARPTGTDRYRLGICHDTRRCSAREACQHRPSRRCCGRPR